MMTLTTRPTTTIAALRRRVHSLVKRIRLDYGAFEFHGAVEIGPEHGMVHLHLLYFGAFIPQGWLSIEAARRGLGKVVWIAAASPRRDIAYTSKSIVGYTAKDTVTMGRIISSDGWLERPSFGERLLAELARAKPRPVSQTPPRRPTPPRRSRDLTDYRQQAGSWPIERRQVYAGL
jgi:hypothetical protein